jgi:hypothetical protein
MFNLRYRVLKNFPVSVSLAMLTFFCIGSAHAVEGEVNIHASVVLNYPFPITQSAPLVFGVATIGKQSGTISMPTDSDNVAWAGSVTGMDTSTAHRGSFYFVAPAVGTYQVSLPARTTMTNMDDPSKTIQLAPAVSVENYSTTIENEMVDVFVGGTVLFGANTVMGPYESVFTVEVTSI